MGRVGGKTSREDFCFEAIIKELSIKMRDMPIQDEQTVFSSCTIKYSHPSKVFANRQA